MCWLCACHVTKILYPSTSRAVWGMVRFNHHQIHASRRSSIHSAHSVGRIELIHLLLNSFSHYAFLLPRCENCLYYRCLCSLLYFLSVLIWCSQAKNECNSLRVASSCMKSLYYKKELITLYCIKVWISIERKKKKKLTEALTWTVSRGISCHPKSGRAALVVIPLQNLTKPQIFVQCNISWLLSVSAC